MIACASCGRENPPDARFCNACGSPLRDGTVPGREERKIVSVLFADLVGFTARAERLDPEDVRAIQTPYFQRLRAEIEACGGTVEKFIGDAVMAVFGAPVAHGDDPERAVRAALAIREAVGALNAGDPELDLRVRLGVNTGEAIVSLDANPSEGQGLVAGDVVNTASRLQSSAPPDEILVGEETYRCTKSVIVYRPVEPVTAKGKQLPVQAWAALGASAPPGQRPAPLAPIVGRDHELAVLAGIWARVVGERRPHLVTVFGPAGIGKTRLAGEFAARLEEAGAARAIRGRSAPYGETTTYGAFAQHVKQLARIFDSDTNEAAWAKLHDTVAGLAGDEEADEISAHVGSLIGLDVDSEAADRDSLFYSVRRLLEEVARRQPTLLVFEDVQWADAGMLDLLEVLASRVHDVPLLLLALARPDLLEHRSGWGGGLPGFTALPLEALGTDDAEALAASIIEATIGGDGSVAQIAGTAEGNPLFIEELAASLAERTTTGGELPTTIRAIVSARLDALPQAERTVLLDAAVVGKVFWRGALAQIGSGGDSLPELLDSLEGRDFVRREPVSRFRGDQQFSFKHVIIRDIAYATLPRPVRRERHATVAGFLEEATGGGHAAASALAHHWQEAGDESRAVDYFVVAAEQAGRGWAKHEAVAFYQQALGLIPEGDDRRRDVARRQAVALQAAFHIADAELLAQQQQGPESADSQV